MVSSFPYVRSFQFIPYSSDRQMDTFGDFLLTSSARFLPAVQVCAELTDSQFQTLSRIHFKASRGGGAQQDGSEVATKPDNLNAVTRTHMVQGEMKLSQVKHPSICGY